MLDYGLCCQTVTVYRMGDFGVERLVAEGCLYDYEDVITQDVPGGRLERKFLLVMPGSEQRVFPGDRIYDGVGPETVDWARFIPASVPGLSIAEYARPCRWAGDICHTEAGRK